MPPFESDRHPSNFDLVPFLKLVQIRRDLLRPTMFLWHDDEGAGQLAKMLDGSWGISHGWIYVQFESGKRRAKRSDELWISLSDALSVGRGKFAIKEGIREGEGKSTPLSKDRVLYDDQDDTFIPIRCCSHYEEGLVSRGRKLYLRIEWSGYAEKSDEEFVSLTKSIEETKNVGYGFLIARYLYKESSNWEFGNNGALCCTELEKRALQWVVSFRARFGEDPDDPEFWSTDKATMRTNVALDDYVVQEVKAPTKKRRQKTVITESSEGNNENVDEELYYPESIVGHMHRKNKLFLRVKWSVPENHPEPTSWEDINALAMDVEKTNNIGYGWMVARYIAERREAWMEGTFAECSAVEWNDNWRLRGIDPDMFVVDTEDMWDEEAAAAGVDDLIEYFKEDGERICM